VRLARWELRVTEEVERFHSGGVVAMCGSAAGPRLVVRRLPVAACT